MFCMETTTTKEGALGKSDMSLGHHEGYREGVKVVTNARQDV